MGLLSPDGEVIDLGARVLRIEAFAELGYAASIVAYGAFVGAGDTKWPSVMNFTSMWIVRILPAIFLVRLKRGKWLLYSPHYPAFSDLADSLVFLRK